jgi:hypothetical protein
LLCLTTTKALFNLPDMKDYVLAYVLGTGAGLLLCVGVQKILNNYYVKHCPAKAGHQLVYMKDLMLGDKYYCLDKRTL